MIKRLSFCVAALCVPSLAAPAPGATLTYTISGTATTRNLGTGIVPAPWANFEGGDFSVSLTLDTAAPDTLSDPRYGAYTGLSAETTINGIQQPLLNPAFTFLNYNGNLPASVEIGVGGYVVYPSLYVSAGFRFVDPTGQNLPRVVLDLNSLPTPTNYFLIFNGNQYANFNAVNGERITTPSPGTVALFAPLGVAAVSRRRAGHRR